MSDITNIIRKKERLEAAAGDDFPVYLSKFRQYCSRKISKEEFDTEIAKFLSAEALRHHNELIILIGQDTFDCTPSYTPNDFYLERILADRPKKKLKSKRHVPTGMGSFEPVSISSYLPVAITSKYSAEKPSCKTDFSLPDRCALRGLMYALAWEKNIDVVDQQAIEMIAFAVRFQIKAIVMAVLSRRNAYKIREGKFKYAMGCPAMNVYLQNAQKLKKFSHDPSHFGTDAESDYLSPCPRPSIAWAESMAATEFACSGKSNKENPPVSPWDLYEALQIYRGIIPSHEVYCKAMEEISATLYHPGNDELEQALLRKLQERHSVQAIKMIADGYLVGDGSWELHIYVTDLQVERTVNVKGDLHIGGLMLKLVEDLDVAIDWSDHALWWPKKNTWLCRTKSTLDQCGVQADALLHFTPMHKFLRLQLPDLRFLDIKADFSSKTFSAVVKICKELGIRHPEELSLCRPLVSEQLKKNYPRGVGCTPRQRSKEPTAGMNLSQNNSTNNNNNNVNGKADGFVNSDTTGSSGALNLSWTDGRSYSPTLAMFNGSSSFLNYSLDGVSVSPLDSPLSHSPKSPSEEAKQGVLRPKSLAERARLNTGWLDSSLSLMEQDIREFDTLLLRFKFYSFYDLNMKYDAVRINQIYEQAKWSILSEEIDCTEEEMMLFAALQVQVNLQTGYPQPDPYQENEDVDSALTDLQVSLEGTIINRNKSDMMSVPELADVLSFKPKKFTLKGFRQYYITLKDTNLNLYKSRDDAPAHRIALKGSEVTPDVNLTHGKYGIRLEVPHHDGMTEYWIRCSSEEQYSKWMAACRLAARGKTMADSTYDAEVKSIQDFLDMQKPALAPVITPSQIDINPDDMIAPRFAKKLKTQKIIQRILEAHANVKDLNLLQAKMNYIKAWQALPEYGISLFIVRFAGGKRDELLGVAHNRLMRMDLSSGNHIKTWRYNTMKAWNVNWEVRQVRVQFEEENIALSCLTADCKVVHEFIGGYIFLSMRAKDRTQTLNEDLFHKLTGGWI